MNEAGLRPLVVVAPRACSELVGLAAHARGFEMSLHACEELPYGDRAALAAPAAELARLGCADLLGIGPGSLLALLLACTANDIRACALVGGPLVHARLDAAHPNQPLELALNLGCPLRVFHGEADPDFPPEHLALARAKLDQFARDALFHELAGAGAGWCDPSHPGYRPAQCSQAVERALAALTTAVEQNP